MEDSVPYLSTVLISTNENIGLFQIKRTSLIQYIQLTFQFKRMKTSLARELFTWQVSHILKLMPYLYFFIISELLMPTTSLTAHAQTLSGTRHALD